MTPAAKAADVKTSDAKTGETEHGEAAGDVAGEFREAARDLSRHLATFPKAAASVLPEPRRVEPRRVEPRRPPPPASAPPAASAPQIEPAAPPPTPTQPTTTQSSATQPNPTQTGAPDVAASDSAQRQTAPAMKPVAAAPIVARRLGAAAPKAPIATKSIAPKSLAGNTPPADQMTDAEAKPSASERAKARHKLKPPLATAQNGAAAPAKRRLLFADFGALCVSLSFLGAIAGLVALFLVIAPWPDAKADLWAINRTPAIVIEDRNGIEITARGARYGEAVAINDLPPYLVKAFLATEDRRFYEHHGVDLRGTMRALVTNVASNGRVQGGSTITQQLAKNLFLSPEQTYIRKLKEAMLAFWMEGRYSKDQILSLYINRIYYGAGAYGVESAAHTYFNKSARDVSLSEAALLAGLPQAPSTLAPTQNPLGAQDRAFEVIDNMKETGVITEFEAREARKNPPVIATGAANNDIGWFFDYVAERARALAGKDAYDIVIRTTLDQKLQRDAEAAVKTGLTIDAKVSGAMQGALIAYDNDGAVRAMVGGRSYVESQFNRATQAKRQPGSAFKPIVYATGFENGLTPQSRFIDQPIDIAGWKPTNYDNRYRGSMRISEAVARSINTIAVQVSEKVGRRKVVDMARRLGISSEIPEKEAGIALGGFSATLDELTAAYIPFADGGFGVRPYAITEITDGRGATLYTRKPPAPTKILEPRVARDVTHVLYQVVQSGTGRAASLGNRQAAGKTGTTNDWRDAWFIGYTAQMTTGVWVGNDDFQPMDKITGGAVPARIWKDFMLAAHADLPREKLEGAYSAVTYTEGDRLLSYYQDVANALGRVIRDGD